MTIQTVKLGRERYVVMREKDYRQLKAGKPVASKTRGKRRRLTRQDRSDIAEAKRRLNDANDRIIPYEQARKQLGLA